MPNSLFVFHKEDRPQIARVNQAIHNTDGVTVDRNATCFYEVAGGNRSFVEFLGEYYRITDRDKPPKR